MASTQLAVSSTMPYSFCPRFGSKSGAASTSAIAIVSARCSVVHS